jgi:hypothetical protein
MAAIIHTDSIRQHPAQAALTVLGLSGVVLVFLPFEVFFFTPQVPIENFLDFLGDFEFNLESLGGLGLGGPLVVLPFFISAGYVRWVLTAGLSRWEIWLGYALALIVVVLILLLSIQVWWTDGFDGDYGLGFICAFLVLGLGAGAWFVIQNLRRGASLGQMALVALQLAYLPLAICWLTVLPISDLVVGQVSDVRIGAYLAFLTVLIYTVQVALSVRGQRRFLLRLLPLAFNWGPCVALVVAENVGAWFKS